MGKKALQLVKYGDFAFLYGFLNSKRISNIYIEGIVIKKLLKMGHYCNEVTRSKINRKIGDILKIKY